MSPRRFQCRRHEPRFAASRAGEHKFALSDAHAMQILRVVQAEQSILQILCNSIFTDEKSQMSPGTLDSAGSLQFWKVSNQHEVSMTNRVQSAQVLGFCSTAGSTADA